jgi:peptidyl-tRNA hydrolase
MSKLYILVRGDLSKSQQAVQACHATAEFMLNYNIWENETIVLLKVRDLKDLHGWKSRIVGMGIGYSEFHEPDIGDESTAIAVCGPQLEHLLRDIPLV